MLPWLLYNLATIGALLPSSGQAVRFLSQAYGFNYIPGDPVAFEVGSPPLGYYVGSLLKAWVEAQGVAQGALPSWALVAALVAAATLAARGLAGTLGRVTFVFAFVLLLVLVYSLYIFGQWFFARYFAGVALATLVLAGAAVSVAAEELRRRGLRFAGIATVVVALAFGQLLYQTLQRIESIGSVDPYGYYDAALWVNENLPEDAVVGAFQTGILGYYLDRRFHGLDGKINQEALEALRAGTIDRYVEDRQIDVLLDWERPAAHPLRGALDDACTARGG